MLNLNSSEKSLLNLGEIHVGRGRKREKEFMQFWNLVCKRESEKERNKKIDEDGFMERRGRRWEDFIEMKTQDGRRDGREAR